MLYGVGVCIVFMSLMSLGMSDVMADTATYSKPIVGVTGAVLGKEELGQLSNEALDGSGEAARRVATHFRMLGNDKEALYWGSIAAENGSEVGTYNVALLLSRDPDPRNQRRAKYWLHMLASRGGKLAKDATDALNKLGVQRP